MESDTNTSQTEAENAPKQPGKARLRTLADIDRRTGAAQDAFRLRDSIAADLGGAETLTAMQAELVDNVAVLGAMLKDAAYRANRYTLPSSWRSPMHSAACVLPSAWNAGQRISRQT